MAVNNALKPRFY